VLEFGGGRVAEEEGCATGGGGNFGGETVLFAFAN
jgi:hypothetical protein